MSKLNRRCFLFAPIAAFFGAMIPSRVTIPCLDFRDFDAARRLRRLYSPYRGPAVTFFLGQKSEITASDKTFDQAQATVAKLCRLSEKPHVSRSIAETLMRDFEWSTSGVYA